ncbi:metallophosphoesterase family protein [Caldimonas tepidiphila]|uniref:metallophosphoesterase family protein n=1 Tax=Caldimonas tepidiphila TaxID=2315841 RepID=UPI000E5C3876|nr:metallophosphoesterase [Caldimonas tepidiphila]
MTCVMHISDPHFGTQREPVVEAVLRLARQVAPELVVLSGDVTQRARRSQFAAAAAFLQRLPEGTAHLAVPGNHDIPLYNLPARLASPYGGYKRVFGSVLEPLHESAELLVIGLNTTRPYRHKNGEVSPQQIDRVARRLRAARAEQLRIVVAHHPLHVTREKDIENLLRGHEGAARAWAAAGADLVLGGHIHLAYVKPLSDHVKGLSRPLWAVQAGTATSHRVRGTVPNSLNLIRHEPGRDPGHCVVERWDYVAASEAFEPLEHTRIPLHR